MCTVRNALPRELRSASEPRTWAKPMQVQLCSRNLRSAHGLPMTHCTCCRCGLRGTQQTWRLTASTQTACTATRMTRAPRPSTAQVQTGVTKAAFAEQLYNQKMNAAQKQRQMLGAWLVFYGAWMGHLHLHDHSVHTCQCNTCVPLVWAVQDSGGWSQGSWQATTSGASWGDTL